MLFRKLKWLPPMALGAVTMLSATANAADPAKTYSNTFDTAVVDGTYDEWDLSLNGPDYFAPLYEAGDPGKEWLANSYVRYDCNTNTMYVLVLDIPDDNVYIAKSPSDAWVKIRAISNDNMVDLGDDNGGVPTGEPPESSWSPPDGQEGPDGDPLLVGYEASFPLDPGSYDIEIHTNTAIDARTLSTGRSDALLYVSIECAPQPKSSAIDVEKSTNGIDADEETGPVLTVGDVVAWTYVVTNTGEITLTDIVLVDDKEGSITTCPTTTLAPGESMTCSASGTAVEGQYRNVATVTASDGIQSVSDNDPSHYIGQPVEPPPPLVGKLNIEKATNGHDADDPTGPNLLSGTNVVWEYTVTNIGNADLFNVTVTDDQGVTVTCPQTTLAVGESMVCSASGTAEAGQYANVGTANGDYTDENGDTKPADEVDDPSHYFGADPSVAIEKSTQGQDADDATGPYIEVGDTVFWLYSVTNTGNVDLTDLTVSDDQGVLINCGGGDGDNVIESLAVGETKTCLGTGTATEGQYTNVGTVDGGYEDDDGNTDDVTDDDPSNYYGAEPGIDIEKCTSAEALTECTADNPHNHDNALGMLFIEGDTVYWTFTTTNTGNITLTNVVIEDSIEAVDCGVFDGTLTPGESVTCTATGTATLGQYANQGTATGDYTVNTGEDGTEETRTAEDMDPSHYYAVVDNQPSIELSVTDFTSTSPDNDMFSGMFVIQNASDGMDVEAIVVTDISYTIEYRVPKGGGWVAVDATCTSDPSPEFVFEGPGVYEGSVPGTQDVSFACTVEAEQIPDDYNTVRVDVCVNIFNRDNTFCTKSSMSLSPPVVEETQTQQIQTVSPSSTGGGGGGSFGWLSLIFVGLLVSARRWVPALR